jgi:hypothetical protein
VGSAVFSNRQQAARKAAAPFPANPLQALPNRFRDRFGHTFACGIRQLLGEFMGFLVLDI